MKPSRGQRVRSAWAVAAIAIGALALFLVDSLTLTQVGTANGQISVPYPSAKIQSGTCREVGVVLASGKVVLAQANPPGMQCQPGRPVLVRHLRTRILGLSSYEAVLATGAGL
jgi:hypothetical protein